MDTLVDVGYYHLFQCWAAQDEYSAACEWIKQFRDFEARWDFNYGRTWLNNVQYPSRVYFSSDQDYLMFKLKFPGLIR